MKRMTLSLAVGAFVAFAAPLASPLAAQGNCVLDNATNATSTTPGASCNVAVATSVTVNPVMSMTLSATSTTLTTPTEADFVAGVKADNGPTVTVQANTGWKVVVSSPATFTGPAGTSKSAGDLQFKSAGDNNWYGVNSGAKLQVGTATASTVIPVPYQTKYSWTTDAPGSYSLNVTFTISAP